MIAQDIFVKGYSWHARIYYAAGWRCKRLVLEDLRSIGCRGRHYRRAEECLSSGNKDTGLTYSNLDMRETVMAISAASSPEEFMNSWIHEMLHLQRQISSAFGLDPYGEDAAYLIGDIAMQMFPVARNFLCPHCRERIARKG